MLEYIEWRKREQAKEELRAKLKKYEDGYFESQRLLEALQKDNDTRKNFFLTQGRRTMRSALRRSLS